jgi:hypothetical protein
MVLKWPFSLSRQANVLSRKFTLDYAAVGNICAAKQQLTSEEQRRLKNY